MHKFFIFLSFCAIIFGSFFSSTPVFADTTIQLGPIPVSVKAGEVFDLTVDVIPPGVKSYTIRLALEFPPDLVNVKTWTYEPKWIPVRKSGYDVLNNVQGVFIRTAGYPNGFDSNMTFGKITFVAKKSGVANIRISNDSFVFDKQSNNVASLPGPISVKISEASVPNSELTVPPPTAPKIVSDSEIKSVKEEIISPNFLSDQKITTSTEEVNFVTSTTSTEQILPVVISSKPEESEKMTSVAPAAQKVKSESKGSNMSQDNWIYFLIVILVINLVLIAVEIRSKVSQHTFQSK